MKIEPAKYAELRVKHLEMIQGVITRMAAQAASLKNYCVTLTTTVCGFAITFGYNPLRLLGVGQTAPSVYHLFEQRFVTTNMLTNAGEWQWKRFQDHIQSAPWPPYLTKPPMGWVMPLSSATAEYDFVSGIGHKNLGAWVDQAAIQAGR